MELSNLVLKRKQKQKGMKYMSMKNGTLDTVKIYLL